MNTKLKIFFAALSVMVFATFCFSWEQHEQKTVMEVVKNIEKDTEAKPSLSPKMLLQKEEQENKIASEEGALELRRVLSSGNTSADEHLEPKRAGKRALQLIREASLRNDKSILQELTKAGKDCYACDSLYKEAKKAFNSSEMDREERRFLAEVLARSENGYYQQLVLDRMNNALKYPEQGESPGVYSNALGEAPLDESVVDSVTANLQSENPYVRDMALTILTRDGTLHSAQELYEFTVQNSNPDGFYSENMGLGRMKPQPEAMAYLEDLARQRDAYSHLAIKALLNSGRDGLERVVSILSESGSGSVSDKGLLSYAVNHVNRDPATISYLQTLSISQNSEIRQFANAVINEKNIAQKKMNEDLEYNKNHDDYIVK